MKSLFFKLAVVALLSVNSLCFAEHYSGRIVGVVDGDTVDLLTDAKELVRVRLSGIDAPEKIQAFGNVAKTALSDLTFNRQAVITGRKLDRYGRLIGKIIVTGSDANLQMIKRGLAWHYKKYQNEQTPEDRQTYAEAELAARANHLGLWADKEPIPPWEFRASKRAGYKDMSF